MEISLEGKVALVTGASRGIGKAIAATLASSGASVMLNSRKQDALESAMSEMPEAADGRVAVFAANAGVDDAGQRAVAATIERFGQLDILVNIA
ncbi:MAG: SDR family NAD(P)-dependent oxidoreductase, partial [Actinomycetota bacterium]